MTVTYSPDVAVLTALLHELLNVEQFGSIADLCEALKTRAAQLRIPYDVATIAEAVERVYHVRPIVRAR
jgi:DNA polymerase III delta subunit